jgi:hypothetical protein
MGGGAAPLKLRARSRRPNSLRRGEPLACLASKGVIPSRFDVHGIRETELVELPRVG